MKMMTNMFNSTIVNEVLQFVDNASMDYLSMEVNKKFNSMTIKCRRNETRESSEVYIINFNDDFSKITNMQVKFFVPQGSSDLWEENGYPEQGNHCIIRFTDLIHLIYDPKLVSATNISASDGSFPKMHVALGNGMALIETFKKPDTATEISITLTHKGEENV